MEEQAEFSICRGSAQTTRTSKCGIGKKEVTSSTSTSVNESTWGNKSGSHERNGG